MESIQTSFTKGPQNIPKEAKKSFLSRLEQYFFASKTPKESNKRILSSTKIIKQPSCLNIFTPSKVCVGLLSFLIYKTFDAIVWKNANMLSPYCGNNDPVPNTENQQDYIRISCNDAGLNLFAGFNTGHCKIGVTAHAADVWFTYETSPDKTLLKGTMKIKFLFLNKFADGVYRTLPIDKFQRNQLIELTDDYTIRGNKAWGVIENCSHFSTKIWHEITGEEIPCSFSGLCTPQLLSESIIRKNNESDKV